MTEISESQESPSFAPADESVDVLCRDGGLIRLRELDIADGPAVIDFYRGLDPRSIYRRFLTHTIPRDDVLLGPLTSADARDQVIGAEIEGELVAIGLAVQDPRSGAAEVAFAVATNHQGRGIATVLLEHLAATARDRGRTQFVANTLTSNLAMLDVFEQAGFRITESTDHDDVRIAMTLDHEADVAVARRDTWSSAASIRRVLQPTSVAVVGASRTPGTVGHSLFRNLITTGFSGTVYPVNLRAPSVLGVAAHPSIEALPEVPDLAVIAVPAAAVREVLIACGVAGVSAVVIVTAGFAEIDRDGAGAEDELVDIARWYGMRIVGPNCIGIINTHPDIGLNATFSPAAPFRGPVGFASQSGALGIAALDQLQQLDLGISSFVSLGNKADVSSNDLLQYWENDPETKVAALYLESFGNPRRFSQIARRFSMSKPLVAVKSGRTTSGRRAASSHTAALASSDLIAESLFSDAGIIRVDTLGQLFDVCHLVATQPIPTGSRIAIVGNSGGPGILAADACEAAGLLVPRLTEEAQAKLRPDLLPGAGLSNPVDLIAAATADHYYIAIKQLLADEQIDAIIVVYTDPMVSDATDIADAISRAAATSSKPVLVNFLAADVGATINHPEAEHPPIPVYEFPEAAAAALGHACELGQWRQRVGDPSLIDVDAARDDAYALVASAAPAEGSRWMEPDQVADLLKHWGIDVIRSTFAGSASAAATIAEELGIPVALKVVSDTITHKTDVGGVRLDLSDAAEVERAYNEMKAALGSDMDGAILQPMAAEGIEVIIGGIADPVFGSVVMFGAGGTAAEVWEDRAVALAPLSRRRATELVAEPKIATLLAGHRGAAAADVGGLEDMTLRVGALLDAHPEVLELDLNPVIATADGVTVVDARCRLQPVQPAHVSPRRHLD